jgi:hypothetical protein
MVASGTTFDAPDFTVPSRPVWYIRKPGWIRGPYVIEDMRRFRDLGWLSKSEHVSRDMVTWELAGGIDELWVNHRPVETTPEPKPAAPVPPSIAMWRYSLGGNPCDEPVSFATLQVLASLGRVHARDMVWREGWAEWKRAADVPGLLHGPSEWCSACGGAVSARDTRCRSCGAAIPGFSAPHGELCMACGVLGIVLFPVFPLWLISFAIGSHDATEIAKGRMDPRGRAASSFGIRAGLIGGTLFVVSAVAVVIAMLVNR